MGKKNAFYMLSDEGNSIVLIVWGPIKNPVWPCHSIITKTKLNELINDI